MKNLKVLALNSFATHGMASLKSSISILKDHILPVPTVLLSGLGNMPGVEKHPINFARLLQETFNLVVHRDQRIIVYVGYLGAAEQVDIILELIQKHRDRIDTILVDPIAGDHARLYVPVDIANRWKDLVRIADIAFPNITELKILTGHDLDGHEPVTTYADAFIRQFPNTKLVVTSLPHSENQTGILFQHADQVFTYTHHLLAKGFGGTGDTFVALFILHHFYKGLSLTEALKVSASIIYKSMLHSIHENADQLLLSNYVE